MAMAFSYENGFFTVNQIPAPVSTNRDFNFNLQKRWIYLAEIYTHEAVLAC